MKKVLSSKWFMIPVLCVSVLLLAFYLYVMVRPVSYGMNYTYYITSTNNSGTTTTNGQGQQTIKIINKDKLTLTGKTQTEATEAGSIYLEIILNVWYIQEGDKIIFDSSYTVDKEKSLLEDAVNLIKQDPTQWEALLNGENSSFDVYQVSSFKLTPMGQITEGEEGDMLNRGLIWFGCIMGVVELALIAFAVLSVVFYIKSTKSVTSQTSDESPKA